MDYPVSGGGGGGSGTVTSVSVAAANGFTGTVANATTTPSITIIPGALTPTSIAATGTVSGSNLSGTNTGDQTAGNGITLAGGAFSINTAVTVDKTTAQTLTNKTLTSPVINTPTGIVVGDISGAAPLASPTLTGVPLAPTAAANTNTTQIATTAFVTTAAAAYVPLAGGVMTGDLSFSGTTHAGIVHNNLTTTQRDAISSPSKGMVIYNTTTDRMNAYIGSAWTTGFVRLDGDTMSGALVDSVAGAASTPALLLSGGAYTAGNGTTNQPQLYINKAGNTGPTGFSTAGTYFGINAESGFTGNFIAFYMNGSSASWKVDSSGNMTGAVVTCSTLTNTGVHTNQKINAASNPPFQMTGATWTVASGTGTTTMPMAFINAGTGATDWSTAGTAFGVNAPSGFTGNMIDCRVNGGAINTVLTCTYQGALTIGAGLTCTTVTASGAVSCTTLSPTGTVTLSVNGAANTPALYLTGSANTGNTTTSFPLLFLQTSGATAATNWSTNGTCFGINAASGFTGDLVDLKVSSNTVQFKVTATGVMSCAGSFTAGGSITTGAPSGGTAGAWKLGIKASATVALDTANYIQLDVGGTAYKIGIVT